MPETLLDEPVKTKVLKAIQACIEGVAGVSQVIRNPSKPVPDKEIAKFPLVYIWDESEDITTSRNRIDMVTMPTQIEIWVQTHESTFGDEADIVAANIYKAILTDKDIHYYSMQMKPEEGESARKFLMDEFLGMLVLRYTVQYSYKWKDPYILVKQAR